MPQPAHIARSRALEHIAGDVHALAFDVLEPSRSIERSDRLTAEGERIAAALYAAGDAVRAEFRGRGR
jgi:hypothetical protein